MLSPPSAQDFIDLPADFGTRFMLVVDTEEEFDWGAPFNRASTSVSAMEGMERGQDFFCKAGMRPLYVADYPVIDNPRAGQMLAQWVADGDADIGAHCHPWVNPPHIEEVSTRNSFAGNLPEELERAKITALRDRITEVIGKAPIAFRAGRYGIGPGTGGILKELGFLIDSSIRSRFDYSDRYGPDFFGMPLHPYRTGPEKALVELPLTTAFTGLLSPLGDTLQPWVERRHIMSGILSRSGLLNRIPLTPEAVSAAQAIQAIDQLIGDGVRLLMFSFHSPTLEPGNTPYVRNKDDLASFYRWWDQILNHLALRNVASAALDDVARATVRNETAAAQMHDGADG